MSKCMFNRIKKLIQDHRGCWGARKKYYIKWRIEAMHKDIDLCTFFFLPTIAYQTYPYRYPHRFVFDVYFLHWYIGIGEWCHKEDIDEI